MHFKEKIKMPSQLKYFLSKTILNFTVLLIILLLAVMGKTISPEFTTSILANADRLVSDLILVFIAISLGAFINNFQIVLWGSIASFIVACLFIRLDLFEYLTIDYLFAVLIVVLGFSSIANLYRHYRELKL